MIISIFFAAGILFAVPGFGDLPNPQSPRVELATVGKFPDLARAVMVEYLQNRCTAESAVIPGKLKLDPSSKSLRDARYAVVVTLRDKGKIVARARADGRTMIRNTIAAALKAMRSPGLSNVVTKRQLELLTIEIEILGTEQRIMQKRIVERVIPGLWGLKLTLGVKDTAIAGAYQDTYILPSTACTLGWDSERMLQQCAVNLPKTPETQPLKRTWYTFSAVHVVGYPADGGSYPLFRGKILRIFSGLDNTDLVGQAVKVANFLVRSQRKDGLFVPQHQRRASVESQLYAAYGLAEIARKFKAADNYNYSASANALLGYVAKNKVLGYDDKDFASVADDRGVPSVTATGFFVLTAAALPQNDQTKIVQQKMVRFLKREICKPVPKGKHALSMTTKGIGLLAIIRAGEFDESCEKVLRVLLATAADPKSGAKISPRALAWIGLAGLETKLAEKDSTVAVEISKIAARLVAQQVDIRALPDEVGSIRDLLQRPATTATAEAAIFWTAFARFSQNHTNVEIGGAELRKRVAAAADGATRFCAAMMFIPPEAYFVENRQRFAGGVRKYPGSAEISLDASAATILSLISVKNLPRK
ncbi:MAG: hypothetical protein KAR11_03815 [Phycisphaerae bacterium]|nr:hypothetical protein [Phycisphaerae bacterium]